MRTPAELCLSLINVDYEADVIRLLEEEGYWTEPSCWRWLGDEEFNYSSVGNQQSRAEQAIIEKLINSIDAKLIGEARIAGCSPFESSEPQSADTPQSISEARNRFFGPALRDLETLSRSITVAATGSKPQGGARPCYTIVDDGEGQSPSRMPETILSLHKGNKDKIKFAQGKFNMGGTGVLEFCGRDRNVQLVVSKRRPDLVPDSASEIEGHWSFTIVRREDPQDGKSSRFSYLAPLQARDRPREGDLLHFAAETLSIIPDRNVAYSKPARWGTLIKLYEYDARRFGTNMMLEDGLMYRARLLLPEPALPIRFHECRNYRGHAGSFDTAMLGLVETLQRDIDNGRRDNVEWYDKLEFDLDGERFSARVYLFKNKAAADRYRRDEGVVFTYNGQCHALMTKDFFRRKRVKQDYIWHSLLVFVDCSEISTRAHERLFMNSRDRLRDGELKAKLEAELEDQLAQHEELRELAAARRKRELAERPPTSESLAKVIEQLLSKNRALADLLGQGSRIRNPFKPDSAALGIAGFIGKRFPTKFYFRALEPGAKLQREAHIGSRARITFETDAANDYFKREDEPGSFELVRLIEGQRETATNYQRPRLHNGLAHLTLSLPDDATEGELLHYEASTSDPSRIEPFVNTFSLQVKPERKSTSGPPGEREQRGEDEGAGKGRKDGKSDQSQDSYLDIPDPVPVYEAHWENHDPPFDKFTAMRIRRSPDAEEGKDQFDFYLNMSNVYLLKYIASNANFVSSTKLRYSVGMTLVALAVLHQEQLRGKIKAQLEDMPDDKVSVHERVAQTTSALAPFLLPLVESVSEIPLEEEALSETAGEAA